MKYLLQTTKFSATESKEGTFTFSQNGLFDAIGRIEGDKVIIEDYKYRANDILDVDAIKGTFKIEVDGKEYNHADNPFWKFIQHLRDFLNAIDLILWSY